MCERDKCQLSSLELYTLRSRVKLDFGRDSESYAAYSLTVVSAVDLWN